MIAFALLSELLQYPEQPPTALVDLPSGPVRDAVDAYLDACDGVPLSELRADYVATFDFDKRASLYLTWHTHGDRRQRGLELVRLKRRFRESGLELAEGELPDFLPALLEFAAVAPPPAGSDVLAELRAPVELVRARLHELGSRHRHLLDAVAALLPPPTAAQVERARRLAAEGPPRELVGVGS